jgi:hypothetical protein
MALIILALIALGITICSGLYIWYMNRQWYHRANPSDPHNSSTTPAYDGNRGTPPSDNS